MKSARWQEIMQKYGPQPKSDSTFTRRCRLLQSWYRVEVKKELQCGAWRKGDSRVGSALVNGRESGANFITKEALAYASAKVKEREDGCNPDLTIDEYRLYNNMLSSQPMCFNLFSDLRAGIVAGSPAAQRVLAAMFLQSGIGTVESVEVEMIPRPTRDYIGDKTAFDAAVLFRGVDGRAGLASIETKYTDHLGANTASDPSLQWRLAEELGLLTAEGRRHYQAAKGFDQIARNLLLTLAFSRVHGRPNAVNYVVALEEDGEAKSAVEALRRRLAEPFRDRIVLCPLQALVCRGRALADPPIAEVLTKFQRRYLDFGPADELLRE